MVRKYELPDADMQLIAESPDIFAGGKYLRSANAGLTPSALINALRASGTGNAGMHRYANYRNGGKVNYTMKKGGIFNPAILKHTPGTKPDVILPGAEPQNPKFGPPLVVDTTFYPPVIDGGTDDEDVVDDDVIDEEDDTEDEDVVDDDTEDDDTEDDDTEDDDTEDDDTEDDDTDTEDDDTEDDVVDDDTEDDWIDDDIITEILTDLQDNAGGGNGDGTGDSTGLGDGTGGGSGDGSGDGSGGSGGSGGDVSGGDVSGGGGSGGDASSGADDSFFDNISQGSGAGDSVGDLIDEGTQLGNGGGKMIQMVGDKTLGDATNTVVAPGATTSGTSTVPSATKPNSLYQDIVEAYDKAETDAAAAANAATATQTPTTTTTTAPATTTSTAQTTAPVTEQVTEAPSIRDAITASIDNSTAGLDTSATTSTSGAGLPTEQIDLTKPKVPNVTLEVVNGPLELDDQGSKAVTFDYPELLDEDELKAYEDWIKSKDTSNLDGWEMSYTPGSSIDDLLRTQSSVFTPTTNPGYMPNPFGGKPLFDETWGTMEF